MITAPSIALSNTGQISANGGASNCGSNNAGGGGGSGGHVWLRAEKITLTGSVSVSGGKGGQCGTPGGDGGYGRITVDAVAVAGVTNPPFTGTDLTGLPGANASSFTLTATNGVAHLKNEGQVARQVRLVVVR